MVSTGEPDGVNRRTEFAPEPMESRFSSRPTPTPTTLRVGRGRRRGCAGALGAPRFQRSPIGGTAWSAGGAALWSGLQLLGWPKPLLRRWTLSYAFVRDCEPTARAHARARGASPGH